MKQKVTYVRQGSARNTKTTTIATNALKAVNMRHSYLISGSIIIVVILIISIEINIILVIWINTRTLLHTFVDLLQVEPCASRRISSPYQMHQHQAEKV